MSNFSYKDAKGKLVQIPVRYGDMNRQVAQIMTKNSENIVQSAPFIACYIKGLEFARDRLQDPTFVSKVNIRERAFDEAGNEYLNTQGANYTVERLMPTPFNLQFTADIWTTNTDQKLQLLEQLLVLFNPSMEIQTNNNFIDWTSLSLLELTNLVYSSRSIPQGLEQDIDIATLNFQSPIWLTTPAKVKKLGIITNIITSMFVDPNGTVESGAYADSENVDYFTGRVSISVGYETIGNYGVLVLNNTAKLLREGESVSSSNIQQSGSSVKGIAKQIIVNDTPVTNSKGNLEISLTGLKEIPSAGTKINIGGHSYTIESFSGNLTNLTAHISNPLDYDIPNGANIFIENQKSDLNIAPTKLGPDVNWLSILDLYPGKFVAGLSTIRLQKPDGNEIVGNITLDPLDDAVMHISFDDQDTLPHNTDIVDLTNVYTRGTVDAIVDPTNYNPRPYQNGTLTWPATDYRLLILEDINIGAYTNNVDYDGPDAWKNQDDTDFSAYANDIIQWDGTKWNVILDAKQNQGPTYITNTRTGVQYIWDGFAWMKSFEGVYTAGKWRLVL
jgi:hypothetical protein